MADNVAYKSDATATVATIATDDDGTAHWQYCKLAFGADNTQTIVTSTATNPLPVALSDIDNAVLDTINTACVATQAAVEGTLTVGSHAVTSGDTFTVQEDGAALTALQLIDDPIFADDAAFTLASSKVSMAGAIRDDALSTLTAVEGDAVPLRVGSTGALHVTGAGGGTQYSVDDAGPTVVTMAGVVRDDSLTTLTEVDGDATLLRVSSTGALHVTGGGGGTEYTEDVASASPIVGTATLMERDDALTTVTPVEGDWIGLRGSAEGALWVQDFNSDGILADTAAMVVDLAAIESLLTTIDSDTSSIAAGQLADGHNVTIDNASIVVDLGLNNDVVVSSGTLGVVTTVTTCNLAAETTKVIGTVNVAAGQTIALAANDGVDIGDVDVTSQPARAAATDTVGAALMTNVINNGTTALTPKFAVIDDALENNELVAAVVGKKIRVLAVFLQAAGTVAVRFEDGSGGTALTGQMNNVANSGFVLPFNPLGWFETGSNTALNLELSAAISVDGCLTYVEV